MHEVEQGRLSLDSPVNVLLSTERQVRDLNGSPVPVTLRQLLSHSSGIPFRSAMQMDPEEPLRTLEEHLAQGLKTIRLPGERLIYASDGFGLAGWLAGQAEGMTYDQLAQRVLLSPLGMYSTSLVPPREYGGELAAAYDGDHRISHVSVSAGMPSGALLTTAEDLARFALLVLARGELDSTRILRAESVDEMLRLGARLHPQIPEGFGLGFSVRDEPGRKLAWWDGQLPGAASRLALLPDHNVGVVVLANRSDNDAVARVGNRVLELFVPATIPEAIVSKEPAYESKELIGSYRLSGMLAPPLSMAERFINLRISESSDGLTFSATAIDG
jgi:CubicO group peptidase (beta-lactamase class C family)